MRVLITGVTGFVGSHMVDYLAANHPQVEVHGLRRWRSRTENIDHVTSPLALHECDLRDAVSVETVLSEVRPDRIFHLAAQSYVPASWNSPEETLTTNIIGEMRLFESVRRLGLKSR